MTAHCASVVVFGVAFFGATPKRLVIDNLKAAVINGSGRHACLHPEFLALCGHFCLEPVACERRDPESKGVVEGGVRYVKRNALLGRAAIDGADPVRSGGRGRAGRGPGATGRRAGRAA